MKSTLKIVLAQLNFLVGDIEGNCQKIIEAANKALHEFRADLIVFPELSITSYPPEDLLYRSELYERTNQALLRIKQQVQGIDIILGLPERTANGLFNSAIMIRQGEIIAKYHKQILPNYNIFDEMRYFKAGNKPCLVDLKGIPTAITICEDLWQTDPMAQAKTAGAELMITLNASPFSYQKAEIRQNIVSQRAREGAMPILYVSLVGGQDELIFDGGSLVIDAQGEICQRANFFSEELMLVELEIENNKPLIFQKPITPIPNDEALIYQALVLGVRDYAQKNNFKRAVIGLSGGIDSALTLAITVDALGKDNVEALLMPSRYTAEMSIIDAKTEADALDIKHTIISIEPIFQAFLQSLANEFSGMTQDITEENLQARCRGTLLMAISNKKRAIVLTTGNKSEMSVGYATLYGDMAGGFAVLKDVYKTMVYRLAKYRNSISPVIPQRVIERAPSAELAENQIDQDSLPPYPILDEILQRYIELDQSAEDIIKAGFDETTVRKVIRLINLNEYKRRQSAPGIRITERAFGKDRRYPISSGFNKK